MAGGAAIVESGTMATPPPPSSTASEPAADATVVRTGRRSLLLAGPICLLLVLLGLAGVAGVVMIATGTNRGEITGPAIGGVVVMLVLGALGVLFGIPIWANRRTAVAVDSRGVWLHNGRAQQVVPWAGLAGVGLYWSRLGQSGAKQYSLELCPGGPIDDRDPVLWALVRDETPIAPDLPRLRYRLPLSGGHRKVVEGVHRFAPAGLWLGEVRRGAGHIGRPDLSRRPKG